MFVHVALRGFLRAAPVRLPPGAAALSSKRARTVHRSPPSASAWRKEVALRPPGAGLAQLRYVLTSQADLDLALGSLGCKGARLEDESSQVRVCRTVDLRDGGSYTVLPQPGAARKAPRAAELEEVTLLTPRRGGGTEAKTFAHFDQHSLYTILERYGADGFLRDDGLLSMKLADLEGGTYALGTPDTPGVPRTAPSQLPRLDIGQVVTRGFRDGEAETAAELGKFFRAYAQTYYPSGTVEVLQRAPFRDETGMNRLRLDAAVVSRGPSSGGVLLLMRYRPESLDTRRIVKLRMHLDSVRQLCTGELPDLAAALAGVTEVELFLAGEGVLPGQSLDELADYTLKNGMTLVLRSGAGLRLVVRAGPRKFEPPSTASRQEKSIERLAEAGTAVPEGW